MPLTQDQATWIASYTFIAVVVDEDEGNKDKAGKKTKPDPLAALRLECAKLNVDEAVAALKDKAVLLKLSSSAVFAKKDVLRAAFDFEMGSKGNREKMVDESGNQEKEVDSRDINKRGQKGEKIDAYGKDGKVNNNLITEATKAMVIVFKEKKRLTMATQKRSVLNEKAAEIETRTLPLFTDNEIIDEFMMPLVRARLISDGAIQDKFSATKRMIDATNKIYVDEELKGAEDRKSQFDEIGSQFITLGGGIATSITSALGVDTSAVKTMIEGTETLMTLGLQGTTLALGVEEKDLGELCAKVPDALGKIIGAATGQPEIGDTISKLGTGAVSIATKSIEKLRGKEVTGAQIGNLIKSLLADVLSTAGSQLGGPGKEVCAILNDILSGIDVDKEAGIGAAMSKGNWKGVASGVLGMVADFASQAPVIANDGVAMSGDGAGKAVQTIFQDASPAISAGMECVSKMLSADDAAGIAKELADGLPDILGKVVGAATGGSDVGAIVSSAAKVAGDISKVIIAKATGDKPQQVQQLLAQCVEDAFAAAPQSPGSTLQKVLDTTKASVLKVVNSTDMTDLVGADVTTAKKAAGKLLLNILLRAPGEVGGIVDATGVEGGGKTKEVLDALQGTVDTLLDGDEAPTDAEGVGKQLAKGLPDVLGKVISAATGNTEIGTSVSEALKVATGLTVLFVEKAKGNEIKAADVQEVLKDVVNAAFAPAVKTVTDDTILKELDLTKSAILSVIQSDGAAGLIGSNGKTVRKSASKLLLDVLMTAPGTAGGMAGASGAEGGGKAEDVLAKAQKIIDAMSDTAQASGEEMAAAQKEIEKMKKEMAAAYDKKSEDEADELVDELEKQRQEYQDLIKQAQQPEQQQKLIMKMIGDMKRDQMIMKAAIAVGSAGIEVASQFFAPLAVGKELLKMVAHLSAAIQRARDLKKFLDAREWAESAVSVYRSTIENFIKNQQEQLTENSIKAAMCALRAASEIAATAFPMAKAVSGAVTLAQQGVDVGFAVYKEANLREAWATTKAALADDGDRKLALKARRLNPTLAKYCIAYGALTEKDPVAVKTMNQVGLTNDMLQSPEAGVKLVKTFLETKFPDDNKVVGKWDTTAEWIKGDEKKKIKPLPAPELTAGNMFGVFKRVGEQAKTWYEKPPAELTAPSNAMAGSLVAFIKAEAAHEKAKKATEALRTPELAAAPVIPKTDLDDTQRKALEEDAALRKGLVTAIKAEIEAGRETLRLADEFKKATGATVGKLTGLTPVIGDPNGFKPFQMEVVNIVVAYRELMADQIDMIESDLLTPAIEQLKINAGIAVIEKKLQEKAKTTV